MELINISFPFPSGPTLSPSTGELSAAPTPARVEKRRICFANEVAGSSQEDEEDTAEEDRTVDEKNSEREDLISASPALVNQPGTPTTATTATTTEPGAAASVRLMRSPTPYPKDLKMLAKYVRHAGTAGGNRNSRGNLDDTASPQRMSMPLMQDTIEQQPQLAMERYSMSGGQDLSTATIVTTNGNSPGSYQLLPGNLYSSSNYENELVVMPSPIIMATPNVSQIREARVTTAAITSNNNNTSGANGYNRTNNEQPQTMIINSTLTTTTTIGFNQSSLPVNHQIQTQSQQPHIKNSNKHQQNNQDLVNNNINIQRSSMGNAQPTPMPQPPPYHIAKTYTKKSPEDLMIYDSFRNLKSQSRDMLFDNNMSGVGVVQRALITPTPSIVSSTGREVQLINGCVDENRNNLPLPPPPPPLDLLDDQDEMLLMMDEADGRRENGLDDSITQLPLPPPPPLSPPIAVDEMDSLSILSKESSNTSPTKSTASGGVRKSESGHSWIFGLHKNPRVLQYQIHYSDSSDLGFSVAQLPNEVSEGDG